MAPGGGNSKKAAGNARKTQAAAEKQAVKDQQKAALDDDKWQQGAKSNAKVDTAATKVAEAARKKAERDALLKAEEASMPSKPKGAGSKAAQKKTRGLDLSGLDAPDSASNTSLNATGIDSALDAFSLTSGATANQKIERHPERRYKAALAIYEERRLSEMVHEKSLRRNQKLALIHKEFEKHPDNPYNQASAAYNASQQEVVAIRENEKDKIEKRLATGQ